MTNQYQSYTHSFREQGVPVSCLRRFHVNFPNEDKFEIDSFFLIGNEIPVCIECKTGEFRQDIKKFSLLRKKLYLEREQFLVCAIGLGVDLELVLRVSCKRSISMDI